MWGTVFRISLLCWVLGCCAAVRAAPQHAELQAVGKELRALYADPDGQVRIAARVRLPAEIDSKLAVGQVLYAVYAKKYIAVIDISNPALPRQTGALSAGLDIDWLSPGAGGDTKTLLLITHGVTQAYSLVDPLHPAPLFGSLPLRPLSAQEIQSGAELAELSARKYRDYGRVHPSIVAGGILTGFGAVMVSVGVPFLVNSNDDAGITVGITLPVIISGCLHIVIGSGILISGISKQHYDTRLRRPAGLAQ